MSECKDFLLEIGTEELPPKQIGALVHSLATNLEKELIAYALAYGAVKTYATSRRLAVLVLNLSVKQSDQDIEFRGPSVAIAFDQNGQPNIAATKFSQVCGVEVEQLQVIADKNRKILYYKTTKAGQTTAALLPEIVKASIKKIPLQRSMRWGDSQVTFARPVRWVVMLFGRDTVATEILGVRTANKTMGHRFHCPKPLVITEPKLYESVLAKKGFVIVDPDKRRQKICEQITAAAKIGTAVINEKLLQEIVALVEWPVALMGSFSPSFLEMPPEVLITVMEKQQRYFPIIDMEKKLLPYFIIISNIASGNPKQVAVGNERVIRARLTDAQYFYRNDLNAPLISYSEKLKSVVFQAKLGSLYDKTMRLKTLSSFITAKVGANVVYAQRAAELAKCDLMTSMVWEFPELQGIMGGYYARTNEPEAVVTALSEQYLPRFAKDHIPKTDIGCVLALADRIDSLVGLFGINKAPSGEKDPLGLRRTATGIIRIILGKQLSLDLKDMFEQAWLNYAALLENNEVVTQALHFIYERLRYMYVEQGKNVNVFRAVLANEPTDLIDFAKRFEAVDKFSVLTEANDLIESYKRVRNILDQVQPPVANMQFDAKLATEPVERDLARVIKQESGVIANLYTNKDYFVILENLVKIKPLLNDFFVKVKVMVEDNKIRNNRLALLKELQKLFTLVADLAWLL